MTSTSVPSNAQPEPGDRSHDSERYRRQFETVAENATLALFILDERQYCTYMNPAAEKLTGYSLAEVQDRPLHDVIHHTRPDGTPYPLEECPIDQAFPQNMREQGEEVFVHKDGSFYPVAFTASPIRNGERTVGTIIEVRDVRKEREAKQQLIETAARMRFIAEAMPQKVWMADATGKATYYNTHWLEYSGLDINDLLDEGWKRVVHPDDLENTTRRWLRAVETGTLVEFEVRILRADGAYRWHLGRAVPQRDADGNVVVWVGTNTDIHEHKEAEKALRRHARQFQLLAEASLAITAAPDVQSKLQCVAEHARRIIGARQCFTMVRRGEGLDEPIRGLSLSIDRVAWRASYEDVAEVPPAMESDLERAVRLDGEAGETTAREWLGWSSDAHPPLDGLLAAPLVARSGRHLGFVLLSEKNGDAFSDDDEAILIQLAQITSIAVENARVESTLRELYEQRRLALESAEIGTWDYEIESTMIFWDQRCRTIFGVPAEEVISLERAVQMIHPDDQERVMKAIAYALDPTTPGVYREEYRIIQPDGTVRWALAMGQAYTDTTGGQKQRFIGTLMDITERRRVEEDLRDMNEELERRVWERTRELEVRNQELQDFAYIASHDLQEPLRKVHSFADLLQIELGASIGENVQMYVERIQSASSRMSKLIQDLLQYSRISTHEQAVDRVDLNVVIDGVLADLELRIKEVEGVVEVARLPVLQGDSTQLRQLFQNLISNALKFHRVGTPPQIRIEVETVGAEPGAPPGYRITVRDNGIGFEQKHAERIFQPFKRLHHASKYEGSGVGLAIVKRIVERHGGRIEVSSVPGEGTTFVITFPGVR